LRGKIVQGLKNRSGAIHTAIETYNTTASQLIPPRDPVTWAEIMKIADLAEFDLLKDTRQQICKKPWAKPAVREAIRLYLKIKRAQEEITRLNIEITRLITFMRDEFMNYRSAINASKNSDAFISQELLERHQYSNKITHQIVKRLIQVSKLSGFSGVKYPNISVYLLLTDGL
jgi:hypothetical protein